MLKKLVPTVVILIWLADKMDNTGMFDSTKQVVPLNLLKFLKKFNSCVPHYNFGNNPFISIELTELTLLYLLVQCLIL